jgi:hypothetical protein
VIFWAGKTTHFQGQFKQGSQATLSKAGARNHILMEATERRDPRRNDRTCGHVRDAICAQQTSISFSCG